MTPTNLNIRRPYRKRPIPFYKAAIRRIADMQYFERPVNITLFCGEYGRDMIDTWTRSAALWLPPEEWPAAFDFNWLRGFDIHAQVHGDWQPREKASHLALELVEAGARLVVVSSYDKRGKALSMKTYRGENYEQNV